MLLDAFMAFLILVAGVQFVYCVLAGNFVRPSLFILGIFGLEQKEQLERSGITVSRQMLTRWMFTAFQRLPKWFLRGNRTACPYGQLTHANEWFYGK